MNTCPRGRPGGSHKCVTFVPRRAARLCRGKSPPRLKTIKVSTGRITQHKTLDTSSRRKIMPKVFRRFPKRGFGSLRKPASSRDQNHSKITFKITRFQNHAIFKITLFPKSRYFSKSHYFQNHIISKITLFFKITLFSKSRDFLGFLIIFRNFRVF